MCRHSATTHNHIKPDPPNRPTSMDIVEGLERDGFLEILRDPEPLDDEDVKDLMLYRDWLAVGGWGSD